jgi:proline dehydrogenase
MLIEARIWDPAVPEVLRVRSLLLFLARREGFKNFAMNFRLFRNTALRFVAGETLEDAIIASRRAKEQKMLVTLDLLGENTLRPEDANRACLDVMGALTKIRAQNLDCNFSVKLTQLGLTLDPELSLRNLMRITNHARDLGHFVRVDMEDSRYTQSTLDIVVRAHEQSGNVGTVIQSYLHRSERDTISMMDRDIGIRLVKGAYLEPESVAFRKKRDTDANFVKLMKILLAGKTYNAIATHDESIISAAKAYALSQKISKDHFEFQMLYGIRRDLQRRLAEEDYNVRIYIPYGRNWYGYFMRRLAERPANVAFIARNLFKN